ncbi:IS1 family transposase [Hymenobacter daeguensis]
MELDEQWSFIGHKRHKAWLWLAVARNSRRVIA